MNSAFRSPSAPARVQPSSHSFPAPGISAYEICSSTASSRFSGFACDFVDATRRIRLARPVEAPLHNHHVPAATVWFPDEDRAEILRMIDESLASGRLTLGPIGAQLEREFAARHG